MQGIHVHPEADAGYLQYLQLPLPSLLCCSPVVVLHKPKPVPSSQDAATAHATAADAPAAGSLGPRTLLVAVDESSGSLAAVDWVASHMYRCGESICV